MDIHKGTLGLVAAVGIVAGAAGAMLMTRGGTSAAVPTTETTVAVGSTAPDALGAAVAPETGESAHATVDTRQPQRPRATEPAHARANEVRQSTAPARPTNPRTEA